MMDHVEYLKGEGIEAEMLRRVEAFRKKYPVGDAAGRIPQEPQYLYYGREVLENAISALELGYHILLIGPKATGKNVLATTLAWILGRPAWDISFHINTDSQSLLGQDTFRAGQVEFRPGPVYQCAAAGGIGILDEINMAKNDAVAVLHALLDHRRILEVPGYDRLKLHPATRFIATMNFGYAGTRDLNEALASRFLILRMPMISGENFDRLILRQHPELDQSLLKALGHLFSDLQNKSRAGEITTRPVDLRGLLAALELMEKGGDTYAALDMGLTNKSFDQFERQIVQDAIRLHIRRG